MIDRISSVQGNSVLLGKAAQVDLVQAYGLTIRVAGAAHLPAAMWAEAPKRVVRPRAHAAALSSVPRIGSREPSR